MPTLVETEKRMIPTAVASDDIVRPDQVIQATLEMLAFGAVIVTSFEHIILYANQRATDTFPLMQPETNVKQAFKSFGWDWESSAIGRLLDGSSDEDTLVKEHRVDGETLFTVASWLPEVADRVPCALISTHSEVELSHRAVEIHERDRLAVVQAILLDQMITEQRELAATAVRSYQKTNDILRMHMRRMEALRSDVPLEKG